MAALIEGRAALIVIDMQQSYSQPFEQAGIPLMADPAEQVARVVGVVDACRADAEQFDTGRRDHHPRRGEGRRRVLDARARRTGSSSRVAAFVGICRWMVERFGWQAPSR